MIKRVFSNTKTLTIILVMVLVINLIFIISTHFHWQNIMKKYMPIQTKITSLRNNISKTHLWFKETISKDTSINLNKIIEKLTQEKYDKYYNSILPKLDSSRDKLILEKLHLIKEKLLEVEEIEQSKVTNKLDQKFDKVFINLLHIIDNTLLEINTIINNELYKKDYFCLIIVFLFLFLTILIFLILYYTKKNEQKNHHQLTESNQLMNNIIDSIDNLIFVKDVKSVYITCNKAYEKFIGTSRENIIGKTDDEFYNKKLAKSFQKHDKLMFQTKKAQVDFKWLSAINGEERYWLTSKSPLKDINGEIIGLVGNSADFTDQRELYGLLKDAQKLVKLGSWEQTFQKDTLYWSQEVYRIFEFELQDSMDFEKFMSRVHPDDREKLLEVFQKSIEKQSLYYLEHRLLFPDNRIKHVVERARHYYDKDNKHIRTLGTVQDITKIVEYEEELRKKDIILTQQAKMAAMGEMIDSIAHQWKQPLSHISMEIANIEVENHFNNLTNDKLNQSLRNITNSVMYMSDTISDFRNFFKTNKLKEKLYLEKTIDKVLELLKSKLIKKNITVVKNIDHIEISIIENELAQVLINILNNAVDALEENENKDKFIIITLEQKNNFIQLSIKDNAGGIPLKIIDKVFNARFTTKEEDKGSGIGLYMSQKIINESLKGKIYVQNSNFTYNSIEYKGAEFIIEL